MFKANQFTFFLSYSSPLLEHLEMAVTTRRQKIFKLQAVQLTEVCIVVCWTTHIIAKINRGGGSHSLDFSHSNQWERAGLSVEKLCPQVRPLGFYFPVLGPRERKSGAITQAQAVPWDWISRWRLEAPWSSSQQAGQPCGELWQRGVRKFTCCAVLTVMICW